MNECIMRTWVTHQHVVANHELCFTVVKNRTKTCITMSMICFGVCSYHHLLILTMYLLQPWPPKQILLKFNNLKG